MGETAIDTTGPAEGYAHLARESYQREPAWQRQATKALGDGYRAEQAGGTDAALESYGTGLDAVEGREETEGLALRVRLRERREAAPEEPAVTPEPAPAAAYLQAMRADELPEPEPAHQELDTPEPAHKTCQECGESKPLDAYQRKRNGGSFTLCRECMGKRRLAGAAAAVDAPTKHCHQCERDLPADAEHFTHSRSGKLTSPCRECRCKQQRERRKQPAVPDEVPAGDPGCLPEETPQLAPEARAVVVVFDVGTTAGPQAAQEHLRRAVEELAAACYALSGVLTEESEFRLEQLHGLRADCARQLLAWEGAQSAPSS